MSTHTGRRKRLLALAVATGTAVVAAAASATAAPSATQTNTLFRGTANGVALQLRLTLPQPLAPVTGPVLPNPVDLVLLQSTGGALKNGTDPDVATSTASLIDGALVTNSALAPALTQLQRRITATLAEPSPAATSLVSFPASMTPLGLGLAIGPLTASTDPTARSTMSTATGLTAQLGSLKSLGVDLGALTGPLVAGLQQLTAALGPLTTAAQALPPVPSQTVSATQIPGIGGTIAPILSGAGVPTTVTTPTIASGQVLAGTVNQLPALVAGLIDRLQNGALLTLTGLGTSQAVRPQGSGTVSTAASNAGDVALLGGLLTVTASKSSATASATGTPGKATAAADATLVAVKAGVPMIDLLNAVVSDQGIVAQLLPGTALGQTLNAVTQQAVAGVNTALNAVLDQLNTLLMQLNGGVSVVQKGTVSTTTSPDGRHAEAHASPAIVSLGLPSALPIGGQLVSLALGRVDVTADRQLITTTTVAPASKAKAPPVKKTPPKAVAPTKKLAFTGAELPVTAGLALLLVGAGAALSRRRRVEA